MELTNEQRKSLKGQGYLSSKDGVHFSCRVVIPAGRMNAQETRKVVDVSEKYGRGYFIPNPKTKCANSLGTISGSGECNKGA